MLNIIISNLKKVYVWGFFSSSHVHSLLCHGDPFSSHFRSGVFWWVMCVGTTASTWCWPRYQLTWRRCFSLTYSRWVDMTYADDMNCHDIMIQLAMTFLVLTCIMTCNDGMTYSSMMCYMAPFTNEVTQNLAPFVNLWPSGILVCQGNGPQHVHTAELKIQVPCVWILSMTSWHWPATPPRCNYYR